MEYKFNPEHIDLVKEQVWECKKDLSIYGFLSDFELDQFTDHLPAPPEDRDLVHLEFGAGMGRGAIQIDRLYQGKVTSYLLDRNGRTENKGIFFPETDEYYCDFSMTQSFCELNGMSNFTIFDSEEDDGLIWDILPEVDLITSRCSLGFHIPLERYLERLMGVASEDVTMIFGMNCLYKHTDKFDSLFKEVVFLEGKVHTALPFQSWLIFKGLK